MGTNGNNKNPRSPVIIVTALGTVLAVTLLVSVGIFAVYKLLTNDYGSRESDTAQAASKEDDGAYSDLDEERIASIIEEAEKLAGDENYEAALTKIRLALITYPNSAALQAKETEYADAFYAQIKNAVPDEGDAPVPESDDWTHPPAQEPVYREESENWGYATLASSGERSVEALVLRELTANGNWSEYFDGTNSDVWLKSYPTANCRVRQTTTITTDREFELFITNYANSYRARTGDTNKNLTTCDMAVKEFAKNGHDHMYSELDWLEGIPVFGEDVMTINGNSWYVYSGYNSGSRAQDYFWIFFFIDESQKLAVEVSFEYVLFSGATLADASLFNEWYLNLSESLLIR